MRTLYVCRLNKWFLKDYLDLQTKKEGWKEQWPKFDNKTDDICLNVNHDNILEIPTDIKLFLLLWNNGNKD